MKKIKLFLLGCTIFVTINLTHAQNGLNFDGINDYIQTTYNGISGNSPRTMEAWIKTSANCLPISSGGTGQKVIVDYGSFLTGQRFTMNLLWSNSIRLEVGGSGISGTLAVNDGLWHHLAVVHNPSVTNNILLYIDGVLNASGSLTVNTGTTNNVRIGRRIDGPGWFSGDIDEVRIWDVAKTQAEIAANMNNEVCGITSDLVAYYRLNEGVAGGANSAVTTAVEDAAGANGTLNGFSLTGATSNWVIGTTLGLGVVVNTQFLNECPGFSITVGSSTYTTTGNFSDTLIGASASGCDSIINTNLTIAIPTNNLTFNECSVFSITVGSNTYNSTGNYSDTLVGASASGCDSIVNTDLTVSPIVTTNQAFNECSGFSIIVGNNTYNTTGNYSDTLLGASASGCDSIVNTSITIMAVIDITVANTFSTLTANHSGASYQWLDCDNNFAVISGATSQAFTATANGNFAVEITVGSCIDTSVCTILTTVGINELAQKAVSIYPNPATNYIQVNLGNQVTILNYSLTAITGELIKENTVENANTLSIDISDEAKGVYFLKLNNITYKVIKE